MRDSVKNSGVWRSVFRISVLALCVFFAQPAFSQGEIFAEGRGLDTTTRRLFDQYLNETDSAEVKIQALVNGTHRQEFSTQIKMLQVALILEPHTKAPCRATFDLNRKMGDLFSELNLNLAIYYYEKAIAIGIRSSESTDKFSIYNILAGLYLKLNDHKKARQSYQYAIAELNKSGITEASSVYNNIGWFYSKIGNSDSALWYLNKALISYGDRGPDDLTCNIQENIGREEERRDQYAQALKKYRDNEAYYANVERILSNLLRNKVNMLRVRIRMNERALNSSIDSIARFSSDHLKEVNLKDVISFYQLAHDYFLSARDLENAAVYFGKLNRLRDSLSLADVEHANALSGTLLNAQAHNFKTAYDAYMLELEAARASSDKNKVIAVLAVISGLLIITGLVFFLNKRRKEMEILKKVADAELRSKELEAKAIKTELENVRLQAEADLRQKELEAQRAQSEREKERILAKAELETKDLERRAMQNELELKKKDLTNMILLNTHVYETNKEMIDRLQEVSRKADVLKSLKSLLLDLKSRNQIEERLSSLQKNIEHLNTEFYDKLKLKYPQLTRAEVELCGYTLINLSNKDISLLKNIEPTSVKMGKTRLRKKLGLGPEEDLLNFIRTI